MHIQNDPAKEFVCYTAYMDPDLICTYKYILDKDVGSTAVVHITTKVANHFGIHYIRLFVLPWMCGRIRVLKLK